ncbi:MAG: 30S ribosomal protein S6 [Desulfosalsimonadaceae bacterium]
MNKYETVFIIDPDSGEADEQAIMDRIRSLINQYSGRLLVFDDWGVRKFAYEIRKKKQGHYIRIEYGGSGDLVQDIERFFRIDSRVLKFMTINLEKNVDPESLPTEEPETAVAEAPAAEASPAETGTAAAETAEKTEGDASVETETESESEAKDE